MRVKQVIIVPRDLKDNNGQPVGAGKIASQVAHAAVANVLNLAHSKCVEENRVFQTLSYDVGSDIQHWIEQEFKKVVLGVDNQEEMFDIYNKAKEAGLNVSLIIDNGQTVFDGVETPTCVAIGPAKDELIDVVTGHLALY